MKNRNHIIVILCILLLCLIMTFVYWRLKPALSGPSSERPDDFPDILIVPDNAERVEYSTPSNTRRAPHTYRVSYFVRDPYPSKNTRETLEEHFRKHGWWPLKYHLLNPTVPASVQPLLQNPWPMPKDGGNIPLFYTEDWVNEDNEHLGVAWSYERVGERTIDPNVFHVYMSFFERDSWISSEVTKYKKIHPEEFGEKFVDANQVIN